MKTHHVLTFSLLLPSRNPDNAGARFVQHIQDVLRETGAELTSVVPAGTATNQARATGTAPRHLLIDESRFRHGVIRQRVRGWLLPALHPGGWALQLLMRRDLRNAVRTADVIDVQWLDLISVLPVVKVLNRRARTVVTFHDVPSQKFMREKKSARSWRSKIRWTWAVWESRALERFVLNCVDSVIVLSNKDRALVSDGPVHVLRPPIAADAPALWREPRQDQLLFVAAMYRDENREGLRWFLQYVWPVIKAQHPAVRLDVAGSRPGESLEGLVEAHPDVRLLGFVEDLEQLYAAASAVIVPLLRGAGVKFKVIDALVRGVPVVTTSVGAEGIGEPAWFAGVDDNSHSFALSVLAVLKEPDKFEAHARNVCNAASVAYGLSKFRADVREIYGFQPGVK